MDEMAKALMDAPLFVALMTNAYVSDEGCCNLFKYARLTLRKPILLVTIGSGFEWRQSKLGILLADEVRLRCVCVIIIITYPLTTRVVGAPQMIFQAVSSIFPCSPLSSGT